jgi:hypothetical protein
MFHWLTWKLYVAIGIATAIGFFVIGRAAGGPLYGIIVNFENNAIRGGMSRGLTSLITEPIRIALEGNPIVCAVIGAIWPVALFWLLLLLFLLVASVLGPGLNQATGTIDGR